MTSKLVVWRAVNSIHGDRLVEIAVEHTRLASDFASHRHMDDRDVEIIQSRIDALRDERDEILELYEEGDSDE